MITHNISFAGAGRVASALARRLSETGFRIDLIVSPSEKNGKELADSCGAAWSSVPDFPLSTDIVIIAVPDRNVGEVLSSLSCNPGTIVVHTAGSVGLDVFPESISCKGIFYPLQTFTQGRKIDFTGLPFLLESSDDKTSEVLKELAESIGGKALFAGTEQRTMVHLAAVFICNFTNHMLTDGKLVAERTGVPFEIFYPLLMETMSKAVDLGPENSQTGPAIRNDRNTIGKHLELLSFSPELKKIYSEVTMSIIEYYKDKGKRSK